MGFLKLSKEDINTHITIIPRQNRRYGTVTRSSKADASIDLHISLDKQMSPTKKLAFLDHIWRDVAIKTSNLEQEQELVACRVMYRSRRFKDIPGKTSMPSILPEVPAIDEPVAVYTDLLSCETPTLPILQNLLAGTVLRVPGRLWA